MISEPPLTVIDTSCCNISVLFQSFFGHNDDCSNLIKLMVSICSFRRVYCLMKGKKWVGSFSDLRSVPCQLQTVLSILEYWSTPGSVMR